LRWKTYDALSHETGGIVYQEFNVTMNYACDDATVALNSNADDDASRTVINMASAVTIDSAAVNANDYAGSDTRGISVCKWTAALEIWDGSDVNGHRNWEPIGTSAESGNLAIAADTGIVTADLTINTDFLIKRV
jgi:hypothetical protein